MKNVLIITYYWPPAGGPGVQRFVKFSKYLPLYGWNPIILTVKGGSYQALDQSQLKEVAKVKTYKTDTFEPHRLYNFLRGKKGKNTSEMMGNLEEGNKMLNGISNFIRSNFFVPDARRGWNSMAYRTAKRITRDNEIDAIITTGPPHSTHLLGLRLKKRFDLPWIADFRDPWTTILYNKFLKRLKFAKNWDQRLENKVLEKADTVTVVGPGMSIEYLKRTRCIEVLYNGYDHEDFFLETNRQSKGPFRLSYIGNFKNLQNFEPLWENIEKTIAKNHLNQEKFEICFTGNVHANVLKSISKYNLEKHVRFLGYKTHREAVVDMKESDLLLFINSKVPQNKKYISGKIFEYMASGTPIVAVGPRTGDVDKILKSSGHRGVIEYAEVHELIEIIEGGMQNRDLLRKYNLFVEGSKIKNYSRQHQAKLLSNILNKIDK